MVQHTIDPASIVGDDHNAPYPRPQQSRVSLPQAPNSQVSELQVQVEQLRLRVEAQDELITRHMRRITALESKVARLESREPAELEKDDGK